MAKTVVGSWSLLDDTKSGCAHMRWAGPGDLGAEWITPKLDLSGPVHCYVAMYGSGTATDGASPGTLDAWGHLDDIASASGSSSDILPRLAISFVGTGFQGGNHDSPATTLDSSSTYTNGSFLSMTGTTSYGKPPTIVAKRLFFYYIPNDTTGGQLDYIDLWMWSAMS